MKKTVFGIMLTLLLMGMLRLASNIEPVKAKVALYDDFDGGLVQWNNFGSPLPSTFQDPSFHDGWGYSTEGDNWELSGSWSQQLLNISNGISLEFRVKQEAGDVWDYIVIGIGLVQAGYREDSHPLYFLIGIYGHNPNLNSQETDDIEYGVFNEKTSNPL
jgi:hypothetical protein